jgi:uncharacterized membrane protein
MRIGWAVLFDRQPWAVSSVQAIRPLVDRTHHNDLPLFKELACVLLCVCLLIDCCSHCLPSAVVVARSTARTRMATLQVTNIPHFISQDEFSRLFLQLAGCLGCRMLKTESGT